MNRQGTVYWFTGLSGAGKSTLAQEFHARLSGAGKAPVYLDGDQLREVFGNDLGYAAEDRLKSAMRNSRLCKLLSDQGIDVVCATISMFHQCRDWNRANIPSYREIYVRATLDVLRARDQKGLYSGQHSGQVRDVMGLDVTAEEPREPDAVIDNDGRLTPAQAIDEVYFKLVKGLAKVRKASGR